jgi:hypothetical protein
MTSLCCARLVFLALLGASSALAQEPVYVFNASCFTPRFDLQSGVVTMVLRADRKPSCINQNGTDLGPDAIKVTYTQGAIDGKISQLQTDVNNIAEAAKKAITTAVADNSVKADQIDALVKSIEDKFYQRVLQRVKAELAASGSGTRNDH